jgi:hypothetical protein
MRKWWWLVVLSGCLPINSDVTEFYTSGNQARFDWCDNQRSDWCPAIGGKCVSVRIGPDQPSLPGDENSEAYDRMSACLIPCTDEGQCPRDHVCNQVKTIDDETTSRCIPRTFCTSDADCGQPKYGGHLFNSECKPLGQPICRQVADPALLSCHNDADCTGLYGASAVCHLQACEFVSDRSDVSCLDGRLMNGQCAHETASEATAPARLLDHLSELGVGPCTPDGSCTGDARVCMELTSGVSRCWPLAGDEDCPAGWNDETVTVLPDVVNQRICIPPVPCMPNGTRSGEDHERAYCPGLKGDHVRCSDGASMRILSNRAACGQTENAQACPEGSACLSNVCLVTDENNFEAWQMHSVPTCSLHQR